MSAVIYCPKCDRADRVTCFVKVEDGARLMGYMCRFGHVIY